MRALSVVFRYGLVAAAAAFVASGAALAQDDGVRPGVFVTLPMTKGFADATHALVEAQDLVRDALRAAGIRVLSRAEDADVVLTVLGRGRGDVELTAALRGLDDNVYASPIPIATNERYIEATLTVGSCIELLTGDNGVKPRSCYTRAFVGLGLGGRDVHQPAKKAKKGVLSNSWEACADALVRDVRAWLDENATRIRALR